MKVLSIECMKVSEVNMTFYDLIDYLCLHLSITKKFDLIEICNDISPLFTKWFKKGDGYKSLYLFKIYLLPFMTWLDHSILENLVIKSGNEDAQQLLNLFDSKISSYCSQPITSFLVPSPGQLMIPQDDSEYTLLAIKFRPPSRGDTTEDMIVLQDVMYVKLAMKNKWKKIDNQFIQSIQLVAVHTKLKLLYWLIPKCIVPMIKNDLIPTLNEWMRGIILIAILPENFHNLEDNKNTERFVGPFSSLNSLWQDDTEVGIQLLV